MRVGVGDVSARKGLRLMIIAVISIIIALCTRHCSRYCSDIH